MTKIGEIQDSLDSPPPRPDAPPTAPGEAPFLRRPEFALMGAQRDGFLAASKHARAERLPQAKSIATKRWRVDCFKSLRIDW